MEYQIAMLVLALTIGGTVRYFRWRAAQSGERIVRSKEGFWLFLAIRVIGVSMMLATLLFVFYRPAVAWAEVPVPPWLRWTGAGVAVLGWPLIWWTLAHLDRNITDTVYVRKTAHLVTDGPYAYVRHPMYVVMVLLVAGTSLLTANWFILVTGTVTILLLAFRTGREEQQLAERFGQEYRDYQARTGRFWPRLFLVPSPRGRGT